MSKWSREDAAWMAGIIEGEGCFTMTDNGPERRYGLLAVVMTDEDVIRRLHETSGIGTVIGPRWMKNSTKPLWEWRARGFERVQSITAACWPWLGQRRRARAKEVLDFLKTLRVNRNRKTGRYV